ncbi:Pimeloyl-ACP methyl ester carboxylesterase [Celeribacter baekdonensis]|uniref:Pimeloyl-ACP methyl ester carboxylesterase n=1 Tax=Celeribacter baekdonensis TaxID=875171 RepID=A0A1G7QX23_9RHOB|nr:alpha/beta hydrolase [Celeribacter baekdonensis]SDG02230.1 Pimeloyl-ACP methyl ester carboxylesterase [Celeribacter baekdonensis]
MTFITADGVRLNLDIGGDGPDLIFQHGLCGDRTQAAQVVPDGVRRLTLECRGHGLSEAGPLERLSLAQFTDDLANVILRKGIRPVVGGISMGAAISLRLAVRRPDLMHALVLARPAWGTEAAPANMAPNAEVGEMLARGESVGEFDETNTARMLASSAPDNLASLRGFFSREPRRVTSALLRQISMDGPGVNESDLSALNLPVLVIGHERDHVHPLGLAEDLVRAIPGARLARITPKADHPEVYRNDFRAALAAFLKGL